MRTPSIWLALSSGTFILALYNSVVFAAPVSLPEMGSALIKNEDSTAIKDATGSHKLKIVHAKRDLAKEPARHDSFVPEVMPYYQPEKRALKGSSSEDYAASHSISVMDSESGGLLG